MVDEVTTSVDLSTAASAKAEEVTKSSSTDAKAGVPTDNVGIEATAEGKPKVVKKKKNRRNVPRGQVHILATFNNTIITITDESGNTIASSSAGTTGFRGSKKGTAYAAQVAAEKAVETAKTMGLSKVDVLVRGIGLGRDAAVRTLVAQRIEVDSIRDITGIPHGGTRPRKAKRN